jgi:hypothetical protein
MSVGDDVPVRIENYARSNRLLANKKGGVVISTSGVGRAVPGNHNLNDARGCLFRESNQRIIELPDWPRHARLDAGLSRTAIGGVNRRD